MRLRCLQLASALTASYIGGSINFAAVSASLATPGPQVAAAMAAGICLSFVACMYCSGAIQLVPVSSFTTLPEQEALRRKCCVGSGGLGVCRQHSNGLLPGGNQLLSSRECSAQTCCRAQHGHRCCGTPYTPAGVVPCHVTLGHARQVLSTACPQGRGIGPSLSAGISHSELRDSPHISCRYVAGVRTAASTESMAMSLAAAMLACCAGIFLADFLGLTGSSLGFAALCASGMASLAGIMTGKQGQASSMFAGRQLCHLLCM